MRATILGWVGLMFLGACASAPDPDFELEWSPKTEANLGYSFAEVFARELNESLVEEHGEDLDPAWSTFRFGVNHLDVDGFRRFSGLPRSRELEFWGSLEKGMFDPAMLFRGSESLASSTSSVSLVGSLIEPAESLVVYTLREDRLSQGMPQFISKILENSPWVPVEVWGSIWGLRLSDHCVAVFPPKYRELAVAIGPADVPTRRPPAPVSIQGSGPTFPFVVYLILIVWSAELDSDSQERMGWTDWCRACRQVNDQAWDGYEHIEDLLHYRVEVDAERARVLWDLEYATASYARELRSAVESVDERASRRLGLTTMQPSRSRLVVEHSLPRMDLERDFETLFTKGE